MSENPGYLSTKQAAEALGLSDRRVRVLAGEARFPGAFRVGRDWVIPAAAVESYRPNPHGVRLGRRPRKAAQGAAPTDAPPEQPAPAPREE